MNDARRTGERPRGADNASTCLEELDRPWRKSSFSGAGNDCVEVHRSLAAVRDSKNAAGPTLGISQEAVRALVNFTARGSA